MNAWALRKRYPQWIYQSYQWNLDGSDLHLAFDFSVPPNIHFHPTVTIQDVPIKRMRKLDPSLIDNLVFHLGLMEIPSYWKATCSPEIVIRAGSLAPNQLQFWKWLLIEGLGEFFYNNKIDFTKQNFLTFVVESPSKKFQHSKIKLTSRTLVPLGAGKDSLVTLNILKEAGEEFRPMIYQPKLRSSHLLQAHGAKDSIIIHRTIDPTLLELNAKGFLNGHTPITAYLSFLSVACAIIFDYQWVAFSNEKSASEATARFYGHPINHQFSKSFAFEQRFRDYVRQHLSKDIEVFSFLRPLYELQILRLFSQLPEHFSSFLSCNIAHQARIRRTSKEGKWCGRCPKCVFVFLSLSPFVSRTEMRKIFGKDLFDDQNLWKIILELIGKTRAKPFECVGTIQESRLALQMNVEQAQKPLPILLKKFSNLKLPNIRPDTLLKPFDRRHCLPKRFERLLKNRLNRPINPLIQWKTKRMAILGFGREGKDTLRYLRKHFPRKPLVIGDQTSLTDMDSETRAILQRDQNITIFFGSDYLEKSLQNADVIMKTPGLSPKKLKPYLKPRHELTSQTQIFFEHCKSKIIGITGSKGKSTTSSMIAHVFKKEGLPITLVGNIGQPVLHYLDDSKPDELFIYELSSYQLLTLKRSPHIAIILNIYPGHLDYHGTLSEYIRAKQHITDFQSEQDHVIYNATSAYVRQMVNHSKAHLHPFDPDRNASEKHGLFVASLEPVFEVAKLFRIPRFRVLRHLKTFKPLPHRLEKIGTVRGLTFVNDSLSTVPETTIAAMEAFPRQVGTLIAGGYDASSDYDLLAPEIIQQKIGTLILFPTTGEKILQSLINFSKRIPRVELPGVYEVTKMREAVELAFEHTGQGKVVLLSPGSPSYNLFKNYEDRGNQFRKEVLKRK